MIERLAGPLIVGAGPVGLTTALVLARAGIHATIIDAAAEILQEPRAVVYHAPIVERFDRIGLLDDLKQIGFLKQRYHYWTRSHELLCHLDMAILRPEDTAYPYNLHLGQPQLAAIILRHGLESGHVEARWGHTLVGIRQDETGVEATIRTDERTYTVRAPWLVGADGGRSGVRRSLDLTLEGVTFPEWYVATNLRFDFETAGFGQSNIVADPDHWAIIPRIDQTDLWRCTYREEGDLSIETVLAMQPERYALFHPDLRTIVPEAISPYRVHERCAAAFRVGRVLLAGDAAHLVNPIGGLGLTGGLLDAFPLGDALVAVVSGNAPETVLDDWAAERQRVFRAITAPAALENRRRVSERDPERRRADIVRWRRLTDDTEAARQALLFPFSLIGRHPLDALRG